MQRLPEEVVQRAVPSQVALEGHLLAAVEPSLRAVGVLPSANAWEKLEVEVAWLVELRSAVPAEGRPERKAVRQGPEVL